jgi:hypothetical protein
MDSISTLHFCKWVKSLVILNGNTQNLHAVPVTQQIFFDTEMPDIKGMWNTANFNDVNYLKA